MSLVCGTSSPFQPWRGICGGSGLSICPSLHQRHNSLSLNTRWSQGSSLPIIFPIYQIQHCDQSKKDIYRISHNQILGQKVSSLGLSTAQENRSYCKGEFFKNLKDLDNYLGLTCWLRQYVPYYAFVVEPYKERKTILSLVKRRKNRNSSDRNGNIGCNNSQGERSTRHTKSSVC